ncbi:hypothetical protein NP493_365g02049 [Ridgeia piscesae]|uniref:Carrier domain-containing protein n=1 Tax=Ridgeia piscesae TaxID=27915 RepID=A0AAD9L321_RIDPI|nr:hypothetical protein NP493_365g02049 [Ridgeia piscesae]
MEGLAQSKTKKTAKEFPENVAIVYDDGHSKELVTYSVLLNNASRSESAFVNIDVDVPVSWLHYLIKQLHINLLLVQPHWVLHMTKKLDCFCPEVGDLRGHIGSQVRGQLGDEDLQLSSVYLRQVGHVTCESSLAYVMTTSGTTGMPKLVKVPHQCIVPNILHLSRLFHMGPVDVVFQASPLTFDPSVVEMFIAMTTGATLLCVPNTVKLNPAKMVDILCQNKTTVIQATPTLMSSIGSSRLRRTLLAAGSALRVLALGGEMCPPFPVLRGWREEGNSTPTSTTYTGSPRYPCWATCYTLTEGDLRSNRTEVPLGDALEGTQLDIRPQPGEDTEKGVLWIGGSDRVCFVGGEEENKKNFADGVVYRNSGDVVIRDSRGQMTYQGRLDEQIKRHGKRLNLVELEQTVVHSDVVKQAAAVYDPESRRLGLAVSVDLMACPAPHSGQGGVSGRWARVKTELEQLISSQLPTYYIPDFIVIRETLPMTRHGKVDKKQLMLMEEFKVADQCRPVRMDRDQHRPVQMECLHPMHNDPADLAVNFLESGGDSLSALRFVSRVEAHFGGVALPDLLDVTLHQTLTDVLVCVRRTLRTHGHLDTATEDTGDSMGGNGGRMTSGQDYGQAHSLGGEKGDDQTVSMSDKSVIR